MQPHPTPPPFIDKFIGKTFIPSVKAENNGFFLFTTI
jgi:hypothetical protein